MSASVFTGKQSLRFVDKKIIFLDKFTDQMAEWYRASASGSVDLGFNSESGQIND